MLTYRDLFEYISDNFEEWQLDSEIKLFNDSENKVFNLKDVNYTQTNLYPILEIKESKNNIDLISKVIKSTGSNITVLEKFFVK